eukprot:m.12596 g.12596  ORF g.12596 m.12596 type:complete len:51 (-) comp5836_c0_seq1:3063-3215(-)
MTCCLDTGHLTPFQCVCTSHTSAFIRALPPPAISFVVSAMRCAFRLIFVA